MIEISVNPNDINIRCSGCHDELTTSTRNGGLLIDICERCKMDLINEALDEADKNKL